MSEYDDDLDPDDDNDGDADTAAPVRESRDIKQLRQKARKFDQAEARAVAAEKKLAFAEAGLDLKDPKLGYFIKGYEGDLTAEAIKAEAVAAGFLAPDAAAAEAQTAQAAALAGAEKVAQAAAGAAGGEGQDFKQKLQEAFAAEGAAGVVRVYREAGLPIAGDNT